ncbi:MAG TPA: YicC/YloC family endoribonuclease [Longimicrobiales bacterium]|nr:YicC/YloC family endoribonuclease [Longimicrobiales bacterium]
MIRSMTGFGEAERETEAGRLRSEVRTVNHRFFSSNLRLPPAFERYEPSIRDWLRQELQRGHINCSLRLETAEGGTDEPRFQLNEARARQYHRILSELKTTLDLPGEIDVALLARYNDLIEREDVDRVDVPEDAIREVTIEAARAVVRMREVEGRRLHDDLEERLNAIEVAMERVRAKAPARLLAERDRLRNAVRELSEGVGIDDERIAREVAMLAERWDISEELVRLRAHIDLFRSLLDADSAEPVGKRLSFVVQEMLRETNTVGSKANDAAIEHEVVGIKNEIERLREQADNVE